MSRVTRAFVENAMLSRFSEFRAKSARTGALAGALFTCPPLRGAFRGFARRRPRAGPKGEPPLRSPKIVRPYEAQY